MIEHIELKTLQNKIPIYNSTGYSNDGGNYGMGYNDEKTNPKFLQSSSKEFGSQCIVLSLDYSKKSNFELIVNSGTKKTNKNIFDFLNSIKDINYGELIVCSVDKDGCLNGYDFETLKKLRKLINVPLICSGGCSGYKDMLTAFNECKVDAVAAGSIFHFSHMTPRQAKIYLKSKGVDVRI